MLTKEQIEDRKNGIGGSDIGAVLGLNPYKSPFDVYLEKTGQVEPVDLSDNQRVHFGNVLEKVVADEYERRTGFKVRKRNNAIVHKAVTWARANIDRSVVGKNMVLECKTADKWTAGNWGPDGSDQVPESYLVQVAWYMMILGYNRADLAVLIGGNDFRIYHFERDSELERYIFERAAIFWEQHVLANKPPAFRDEKDLATAFAIDNGQAVTATDEIIESLRVLDSVKSRIKDLEKNKKDIEFLIKSFMGENAEIILNDDSKPLATWKKNKDSQVFDTKEFKTDYPDLFEKYKTTRQGARPFNLKPKNF